MEIKITKTTSPKAKPADESKLGFGKIFTDHMFLMNYDEGQGWHDARIVPYGPIPLEPSAMCLHYGQADFEGMKAYRTESGKIQLFRPEQNMARMNVSNDRLCIPQIDEAFGVEAIKKLVEIDQDWFPIITALLFTFVLLFSQLTPCLAFTLQSICFSASSALL